jgi:hypothetical protein
MFNIKQKLRKWLFGKELCEIEMLKNENKILEHILNNINYTVSAHTVSLIKHEKDISKLYKHEKLELEPDRIVYTMAASTSPLDTIKIY